MGQYNHVVCSDFNVVCNHIFAVGLKLLCCLSFFLACEASVSVEFSVLLKKPIFVFLDAREMGRERKHGGGEGSGGELLSSQFQPILFPGFLYATA